jgi:hypothetical protein
MENKGRASITITIEYEGDPKEGVWDFLDAIDDFAGDYAVAEEVNWTTTSVQKSVTV